MVTAFFIEEAKLRQYWGSEWDCLRILTIKKHRNSSRCFYFVEKITGDV